jgi:hypothetical protein
MQAGNNGGQSCGQGARFLMRAASDVKVLILSGIRPAASIKSLN